MLGLSEVLKGTMGSLAVVTKADRGNYGVEVWWKQHVVSFSGLDKVSICVIVAKVGNTLALCFWLRNELSCMVDGS